MGSLRVPVYSRYVCACKQVHALSGHPARLWCVPVVELEYQVLVLFLGSLLWMRGLFFMHDTSYTTCLGFYLLVPPFVPFRIRKTHTVPRYCTVPYLGI